MSAQPGPSSFPPALSKSSEPNRRLFAKAQQSPIFNTQPVLLASTYARDLPAILKGVREPGQAVIIDDAAERAVVGRVLPHP